MKLLTKQLEKRFKEVGEQDIPDPIVICKFFDPTGLATWYMTSYEDGIFFGYVTGLYYPEWGYSSLIEIQEYKGPLGLGIERDLHFEEKPFSELKL